MAKPLSKFALFFLIALSVFSRAGAHVGSPDVALEGMAGPYRLLVSIKPPDVIPGTAVITVYMDNDSGVSVYARPIYFYSGSKGAPSADRIAPLPGQPGQFKGIVWLMDDGSSSVEISVEGPRGKGTLVAPIVAVSTAEKQLPATTTYSLILLGAFLFILMVTLIGASVGEGITPKNQTLPARRKRAMYIAFGVAALFSCLLLYGGDSWWEGSAKAYRRFMFKPMHAAYQVEQKGEATELRMKIDTSQAKRRSWLPYLIPDHGKMMHLFIMRIPAMDAFAHLHPVRVNTTEFTTLLPPLPNGKYLAFADIVYNSGFTETLKDTITFVGKRSVNDKLLTSGANPTPASFYPPDPDDAYAFALPNNLADNPFRDDDNSFVCGRPGTGVKMKDGSIMTMSVMNNERFTDDSSATGVQGIENGLLYTLHFTVFDANHRPVKLDPYMGMMGHAAIVRNDGNVYVHIHPVGTISMAAQANLLDRMNQPENEYHFPAEGPFRDSIDRLVKSLQIMTESQRNDYFRKEMISLSRSSGVADTTGMPGMGSVSSANSVSFPYTFPQPGHYRIWVQVKRNGQILTAAFDRIVK